MLAELQAWRGVPLVSHLLATARASRILLWREWRWRARASSVPEWSLEFACLVHDVGKAWSAYQDDIRSKPEDKISLWGHEVLSAIPIYALYRSCLRGGVEDPVLRGLAVAGISVLNHHHGMHERFSYRHFYTPYSITMIFKELFNRWGRRESITELLYNIVNVLLEVTKLRYYDIFEILNQAANRIYPNELLGEAKQGVRDVLDYSSRDKKLSAACVTATGFLALADTIVASLERNSFRIEYVLKRYAGRVLKEKLGENGAVEALSILVQKIRPLYRT